MEKEVDIFTIKCNSCGTEVSFANSIYVHISQARVCSAACREIINAYYIEFIHDNIEIIKE